MNNLDGIMIIDKPYNVTSRDVVNKICKKFNTKKVGHTGTLDPIATGVLVLGINSGTKIIELLTSDEKIYVAEIQIGIKTNTGDITGEIIEEKEIKEININLLNDILNKLTGTYIQEVPIYSAVRVNGKRLYEYARNNETVELPKREVTISYIKLLEEPTMIDNNLCFKIETKVSKGTYIRSLIEDIGKLMNIPTTMKNLRRISQGIFTIEESKTIEEITEKDIKNIKDALNNYDKIIVDENLEAKIRNGSIIDKLSDSELIVILNKKEELLAIYKIYEKDSTKMKPFKMF